MNMNVHTLHEVVEISPEKQRVQVIDRKGDKRFWQDYDQLLIATGAKPSRPPLEGIDAANVYDVNNLVNGTKLKRALEKDRPRSAVIVGGGYIGIEMAEALHLRGMKVSLVQRSNQLMPSIDPDMAELLSHALVQQGLDVFLEETLLGFELKGDKASGVISDKQEICADIVILGLGVIPNSELAQRAHIALGPKNSIKVDNRQQTDTKNIWAAGDCAQAFALVSRRPVPVPLGTLANRQGRVAGMNIGGKEALFPGIVGTAITKFMDTECGRTGLTERQLNELDYQYVSATVKGKTRPRYYPGSAPITVKVLAEKGSGRLLGVQIVGGQGSAKRIDTAATALHAGFTLEDMLYLDLSYAPPFSGVWDPIVIAARIALKKL